MELAEVEMKILIFQVLALNHTSHEKSIDH